jgi:hypothetical protein
VKREAWKAVAAWSALLGALAGMLWIWSPGDELAIGLLGGAALAALALAAALAVASRRSPSEPVLRRVPDLSPATALVALAVVAMLLGARAGLWLVSIGAGLLALGIGSLVRELNAARRRP